MTPPTRFQIMRANRAPRTPEARLRILRKQMDDMELAMWSEQRQRAAGLDLETLRREVLAEHHPEPGPEADSLAAQARALAEEQHQRAQRRLTRWWQRKPA